MTNNTQIESNLHRATAIRADFIVLMGGSPYPNYIQIKSIGAFDKIFNLVKELDIKLQQGEELRKRDSKAFNKMAEDLSIEISNHQNTRGYIKEMESQLAASDQELKKVKQSVEYWVKVANNQNSLQANLNFEVKQHEKTKELLKEVSKKLNETKNQLTLSNNLVQDWERDFNDLSQSYHELFQELSGKSNKTEKADESDKDELIKSLEIVIKDLYKKLDKERENASQLNGELEYYMEKAAN